MKYLSDMEQLTQGTPEWLAWRSQGIGGSDIAAVVGECKYSTPYQKWLEKTGQAPGFEGNFATQRGNELEPKVRARYELINMGDMPPSLAIHPKYDICRVSLDGRSPCGTRILQIKVIGQESFATAVAGKVPEHYVPQVQWELLASGADVNDYFCYNEKLDKHALVQVRPNVKYQGELLVKALAFWEMVVNKTPPPLVDRDIKIVTTEEMKALCAEITAENISKAKADQLKQMIIDLGGHTKVRCGKVLVSKGAKGYRLTIAKETA